MKKMLIVLSIICLFGGCASEYPAAPNRRQSAMPQTDYMRAADVFAEEGDYSNAVEFYGKAIEQNPYRVTAYLRRARLYVGLGLPNKAVADWKEAVYIAPDFRNDIITFAQNCAIKDQPPVKDFLLSLQRNNKKPKASKSWQHLIARGNVCLELGLYDEAAEAYSKLIKKKPQLAGAYQLRGMANLLQNKTGPAVEDFKQSAKFDKHLAARTDFIKNIQGIKEVVRQSPSKIHSVQTPNWGKETQVPLIDFVVRGIQGLTRFVLSPMGSMGSGRCRMFVQPVQDTAIDMNSAKSATGIWTEGNMFYRILHP